MPLGLGGALIAYNLTQFQFVLSALCLGVECCMQSLVGHDSKSYICGYGGKFTRKGLYSKVVLFLR